MGWDYSKNFTENVVVQSGNSLLSHMSSYSEELPSFHLILISEIYVVVHISLVSPPPHTHTHTLPHVA
jgi:hypothetical protein